MAQPEGHLRWCQGNEGLEELVRTVEKLDARTSSVVQDVASLQEQLQRQQPQLQPQPLQPQQPQHPPTTSHGNVPTKVQSPADVRGMPLASPASAELCTVVEDLQDRLQRMEMLLFRLPLPDFGELDRAIADLGVKCKPGCWRPRVLSPLASPRPASCSGGSAGPMESVPEEQEVMEFATRVGREPCDVLFSRPEPAEPEPNCSRQLDSNLLEELGIFYDYQGTRSVTSANGCSDDCSDDTSSEDATEVQQPEAKAMSDEPVATVVPLFSVPVSSGEKKESEAEDSDPERPRKGRAKAQDGGAVPSAAPRSSLSGLRIKVIRNAPQASVESDDQDCW